MDGERFLRFKFAERKFRRAGRWGYAEKMYGEGYKGRGSWLDV